MKKLTIAIDGPAAAGKSTIAKLLAEKMDIIYVDTGAMYRALTLKAIQKGLPLEDGDGLAELLHETQMDLTPSSSGQTLLMDGKDVTDEIRSQEVTTKVSIAAKHQQVREEMVKRQQDLVKHKGVVMDGRDIGTHVLPNADVKIYMIASVEERAERRHKENVEKGFKSDLEQLKKEIRVRDEIDSNREFAPLLKAADAIEVDTSHLTIDQVVEKIAGIAESHVSEEGLE